MRSRIALAPSDRVKSAKWWQEPESLGGKEMILRQLGRSVRVAVDSGSDWRTALEAEPE